MSVAEPPASKPTKESSLAEVAQGVPADWGDTTPEVSEMATDLPWWVSRGLLYVVAATVFFGLIWAALAPIDEVAEARGAIVPEGFVRPLQALVPGTVQTVLVREGDTVAAGQTLVQLDDSLLRAKQDQLQSELEAAQVSLLSYRQANAGVDSVIQAESRVTSIRSEMDANRLQIERSQLKAPVSGIVTQLLPRGPGAVLQEGQTVAIVAPAGARLVAEVEIPNGQIGQIKPGLPALLLLDAFPYQRYGVVKGTVISVSPDAIPNPSGGSFYRAEIQIGETSKIKIRPGLALTARIVTEKRSVLALFLDPFRSAA